MCVGGGGVAGGGGGGGRVMVKHQTPTASA